MAPHTCTVRKIFTCDYFDHLIRILYDCFWSNKNNKLWGAKCTICGFWLGAATFIRLGECFLMYSDLNQVDKA